ncbi:MAG: tRNA 2-thiouridine(34) synthase MnmA [Nanoarchaeota archaeon]
MNKKVVLGMSGGVDSSVAALLLQKQGYDVYGFFMNCSPSGKPPWPSSINWKQEEKDVRAVCKKLEIELFMLDCEEGYERKVISKMFKDYSGGLTPNPDVLCNNVGKFPGLLKKAKEIGADYIATGHYARVRKRPARPPARKESFELLRGKDREKDQSYFLAGLGQNYLRRCLFPVGNLMKEEVRKIAKRNGFLNFDKKGSRGICYLGKIDVKKFLHSRIKEKKGKIIDFENREIGTHQGVAFFTIGEKIGEGKGTRIEDGIRNKYGGKWFVAAKKKDNVLMVAPEGHNALKTKKIFIKGFKLVNKSDFPKTGLKARIRHLGELHKGRLRKSNGRLVWEFNRGWEGVAEGQFIVLYKGEKMVGGGEIRL